MKLFIQVILLKGLNQKSNKQEIKRKKNKEKEGKVYRSVIGFW